MFSKLNRKYAPVILRIGLSFVFLWFGLSQIIDQSMWLSLIPSSIVELTGISAKTIVIFNGVFEVIAAVLLACGVRIRLVATLLFLHMVLIVFHLGFTAIAVRDIGITFGLLASVFYGPDDFSVDSQNVT
jgi:uncharacterized membrane protein YphA (DoxX/SURF4 family)